MAEKAIERYTVQGFATGYVYPTRATPDPNGDWMRYDADLVRDAMRYRTLRILPSNRVIALVGMAPDEMDRVLDRVAAIYAEHGAIDTAISQSEGAQR